MVGILALHGDVAEHAAVLTKLGVAHCEVRTCADLAQCNALIIPGGESTVISLLLQQEGLDQLIVDRIHSGSLAVLGTCAGAIILSSMVVDDERIAPLGLIDMSIQRNAYGTQLQSFTATVHLLNHGMLSVAFIRAPVIKEVGSAAEVLAQHHGTPVIVRQGKVFAATCHPEILGETALHRLFLTAVA